MSEKTQLDKFKEAARELETDDDPQRFKDRLKKLVKPVDKKSRRDSTPDGSTASLN